MDLRRIGDILMVSDGWPVNDMMFNGHYGMICFLLLVSGQSMIINS